MSGMSYEAEQATPLLKDEYLVSEDIKVETRRLWLRNVSIMALSLYSLFLTGAVAHQNLTRPGRVSQPYSPIDHILEYENQQADPDKHIIYSDPPSPEVDTAWEALVYPIYYSADFEEISKSNDSPDDTVELVGNRRYLGTIGVYHALHCMRRLYWQHNEEHYFPNRTAQRRNAEITHALHCLGVIVRDLMCKPDVALYTFGWDPKTELQPSLKSGAQRQCVKWNVLHAYTTTKTTGLFPRMKAPSNMLRRIRQDADEQK